MDKTYKIIELDLQGGPNTSKPGGTNSEWAKARKAAEKIAIAEFEDLLNKHCKEDNYWRLDSILTIPTIQSTKTVVVLKNMGHF